MKLTYETAIATLIQFITLTVLGFLNGLNSVVVTCRDTGHDCISNLIVSLIFFLITAIWFGFVWLLGYTAQERRSRRFAQALIVAEAGIAFIALFNARHHTDLLSLITSLIDLCLSLWIITLALRLIHAGPQRIVKKRSGRR
jgi:hypothetical protein